MARTTSAPKFHRARALAAACLAMLLVGLTLAAMPTASAHDDLGVRVVNTEACVESDENDEWVAIRNDGSGIAMMEGWLLTDRNGLESQFKFFFPEAYGLEHGESVRVWTGDENPTMAEDDLTFGYDRPIWRNTGDTVMLFDEEGDLVHSLECERATPALSHEDAGEPAPPGDGPPVVTPPAETPPAETPPTPPGACVADLQAMALPHEAVEVSWTMPEAAEGMQVHVHRSVDERAWTPVATVDGADARFVDEDVEAGATYGYVVTLGSAAPAECEPAWATAVPFFGAPLLGALALAGGVGAFAALRRR